MRIAGLRVAIIGCGSAGPAAALLLARSGHEVELIERAPRLAPVGAGFLLQPPGLVVLAELGLLDEVLAFGAPVRRLVSETRAGRRLLDLGYHELDAGRFGLGVHRPLLLEAFGRALARAGVRIRLGETVTGVTLDADGRARLASAGGAQSAAYDLVVVASGARSELRQQLVPGTRVDRYPWGALWFIGDDPTGLGGERLFQRVQGTRRMIGVLPTARLQDGRALVSLFWSIQLARLPALRAAGLPALKADMADLAPMMAPVIDQISDLDQLAVAEYLDVRMPRWSRGPVVFLGDAAHAMSPQLGQGANLALWDALTLSNCLRACGNVAEALALYERSRREHLAFYQWMTRRLTPLFQSSFTPFAWARDLVFPLLHRIGLVRREMIRTMAGVKRGIVRRSLRLPGPGPLLTGEIGSTPPAKPDRPPLPP